MQGGKWIYVAKEALHILPRATGKAGKEFMQPPGVFRDREPGASDVPKT